MKSVSVGAMTLNPAAVAIARGLPEVEPKKIKLRTLLLSLLKIGSIGFGGGMALIALMEQEFVQKLGIVPAEEFVNGVGLGQLLGASAVNLAIFIGYRLFGWAGALLSASCFLLPSVSLVLLLSDLYFRYHSIPALQSTVGGIAPVVIALILSAAWSIGQKVIHSWQTSVIGLAAFIAGANHVNAVWILFGAGAVGYLLPITKTPQGTPAVGGDPSSPGKPPPVRTIAALFPVFTSITVIPLTFLKIGLVFFGGGFVLIPLLHTRLVTELGWLRPQEFLDGLAISNLTPGPIAVIATFTGYHVGGFVGALEATIALFTPGVLLMLLISHEYERFRNDARLRHFLAGVNPAVAGLILSAALVLSRTALQSWQGYTMLLLALLLLIKFRWHPAFVLSLGAAGGYLSLL